MNKETMRITKIIAGLFIIAVLIFAISKYPPKTSNLDESIIDKNISTIDEIDTLEELVDIDLSNLEFEDGEKFKDSEYIDENLILTFTRSSCPYCDEQALEFQNLENDFDFKQFYIPTKEPTLPVSNVLEAIGIEDFDLLIDRGEVLLEELNIEGVPTNLVKRKGEEKYRVVKGVLRENKIPEGGRLLKNYID